MAQPQLDLAITDRLQAAATLSTNDVVAIGKRTGVSASLVMRINDDGTVPWSFSLGDEDRIQLQYIHVTNADEIIVTGRLVDSLTSAQDPLVAMFNASGSLLWARTVECGATNEPLMSTSYGSGSIHLAVVSTLPYRSKALMRVFTSGTLSWAVVPGSISPHYDQVWRLANNDVIYANRLTPNGDLIRVNGSGSVVWARHFEMNGSGNNFFEHIATLPNGNTLLAFWNNTIPGNTLFTVELDGPGDVVPGTAHGYAIDTVGGSRGCGTVVDGDGERTFTCRTNGTNRTDLQVDANGVVQWAFRASSVPGTSAGLARYNDDDLLLLSGDGAGGSYLEAMNDGAPAPACTTSDTLLTTSPVCITTDITETLVPAGCALNTFMPTITPVTITPGVACGTVGTTELSAGEEWRVHPVPATDVLWVDAPRNAGTIRSIAIIDAAGRAWPTSSANDPRNGVNVSMLPPGAYVLRVMAQDGLHQVRFMR